MKKSFPICFVLAIILTIPTLLCAATFGSNSANINNKYLPDEMDSSSMHTTYGITQTKFEYTHIVGIDTVDGVQCVRVISLRTESAEYSESWVAQDVNSDVYLLKYWDGEDSAPVTLGKDGAIIMMPKNPQVDDVIFGDKTITHVGVTVPQLSTGLGSFSDCLRAVESDGDIVYHAPGIGQVKKEYGATSGWELKYIFSPKPRVVVIPL